MVPGCPPSSREMKLHKIKYNTISFQLHMHINNIFMCSNEVSTCIHVFVFVEEVSIERTFLSPGVRRIGIRNGNIRQVKQADTERRQRWGGSQKKRRRNKRGRQYLRGREEETERRQAETEIRIHAETGIRRLRQLARYVQTKEDREEKRKHRDT